MALPDWSIVSRIVVHYESDSTYLKGIQLYDFNKNCIVEIGCTKPDAWVSQHIIMLGPGDRMVGAKSRLRNPGEDA